MADPHVDQRLAAILAADVAGYSRLMEADETATVATLEACRLIFREHIETNRGRVVDTAGDSVLAIFETATGAVRAAMAIQAQMADQNKAVPEDRRMRFRIGINLGEIIEKPDGTIYGAGVNVAARLESIAEHGGICISESAHLQVRNKLDLSFEDLGQQAVKNIAEPVRAYRANLNGAGEEPSSAAVTDGSDRPSIAVLAFENLSGDPEQEYFADGIAEDLITALSRIRWLLVIARNSTFTYKGKAVDVKQVGREMGVRYVLEGSVRKGGNRVRISAQLIDTDTGAHVWARRYDRELEDIFAVQDEITETIVAAIEPELGEVERERAHRKPPESLDAWESYQRGLWHLWQTNANDVAEARRLFQRAADLDPNFAQAFAAWGLTLFFQVYYSYADSPLENLDQALRLANKAVALDDKEAMGHLTLGRVQILRGEYDTAIAELRTAIDLNPSSALAHNGLGLALALTGQLDEAISEYDTAIQLSPRDPLVWAFYSFRARARVLSGDYEAAVKDARRAIRHPAASYWPHANLASALALLDRREEAKIALDKLLEIKPDFSPHAVLAALSPLNPEALRPLFKTWIDGLRKAGLDIPDETAEAD